MMTVPLNDHSVPGAVLLETPGLNRIQNAECQANGSPFVSSRPDSACWQEFLNVVRARQMIGTIPYFRNKSKLRTASLPALTRKNSYGYFGRTMFVEEQGDGSVVCPACTSLLREQTKPLSRQNGLTA